MPNYIPLNALPFQFQDSVTSRNLSGGSIEFYLFGTNTPTNLFSDSAGTPIGTSITLNAGGFPESGGNVITLFRDESIALKLILKNAAGATISTSSIPTAFANRDPYFARTAAEIAAGVTPVDTSVPAGYIERFGPNTTPGTTDMTDAIRLAISAASAEEVGVYMRNFVGISETITIPTNATQNLSFIGNGRTSTLLTPLAIDVKQSPENVNALFLNKNNNGHLHFEKLRAHTISAAFTGVFFYAKEGGGDNLSAQSSFSMVVDDCWFSFGTTNSGIFRGGFANLMVTKCVFEATKTGCFIIEGAANHDQQYIGNTMNFCYDSFIYGSYDTVDKVTILVDGLHAYQHLRGPLIDVSNAVGIKIKNFSVEADAANVGGVGLVKLTDCVDIDIDGGQMTIENGSPRGDVGLEFIGACKGRVTNCVITADVGLRLSGAGAIDLTFVDCDFIGCQHAYQFLSGTLSGRLTFVNCRLNDSDEYGMLHQAGTPSIDVDFIGGEVMNAGLGGITTSRNINIATSGTVRFIGTKIGQNDGDADAAYYIEADGSGSMKLIRPMIVGSPPTGLIDPASSQAVVRIWDDGDTPQTLTGAGAVDVNTRTTWVVTTGADALTLGAGTEGQRKTIIMKTDGGDGTLTVTNFAQGTTITFNDAGDAVELFYTNAKWYCVGNIGATIA